ncbi:unnamed protein product [Ectocarpus sp. 12 AP-2014]
MRVPLVSPYSAVPLNSNNKAKEVMRGHEVGQQVLNEPDRVDITTVCLDPGDKSDSAATHHEGRSRLVLLTLPRQSSILDTSNSDGYSVASQASRPDPCPQQDKYAYNRRQRDQMPTDTDVRTPRGVKRQSPSYCQLRKTATRRGCPIPHGWQARDVYGKNPGGLPISDRPMYSMKVIVGIASFGALMGS